MRSGRDPRRRNRVQGTTRRGHKRQSCFVLPGSRHEGRKSFERLRQPRLVERQIGAHTVAFLVGENGSGKSTLLEAIAWAAGFGAQGGSRDQSYAEGADGHALGRALRLAWRQRVAGGFFLRAETFFNFASYLEEVGSTFLAYGGKSLHKRSHGEAFLALFHHRFEDGLYLLDEP